MIHFTLVVIIINGAAAPPVQELPIVQEEQPAPRDPKLIYMSCDQCAWTNGYDNLTSAKMGAASHRRWCRDGHRRKKDLFGGV